MSDIVIQIVNDAINISVPNDSGQIVQIPNGPAGPQGIQGPAGPTGATGPSGGANTLDELTDVTITTPVSKHLLAYNGAQFVNQTLGDIGSDIDGGFF